MVQGLSRASMLTSYVSLQFCNEQVQLTIYNTFIKALLQYLFKILTYSTIHVFVLFKISMKSNCNKLIFKKCQGISAAYKFKLSSEVLTESGRYFIQMEPSINLTICPSATLSSFVRAFHQSHNIRKLPLHVHTFTKHGFNKVSMVKKDTIQH